MVSVVFWTYATYNAVHQSHKPQVVFYSFDESNPVGLLAILKDIFLKDLVLLCMKYFENYQPTLFLIILFNILKIIRTVD